MNFAFAKIISNLQIISSSNAYYIYPKGKKEKICHVEISIPEQNENNLCYTLLFGSDKLEYST